MIDTHRRTRRNSGRLILIGVLAVSLMGNAVAVGAVLKFGQMRHALLAPDAGSALFPRSYRREFSAALAAHQPEIRAHLQDLVAARSQIVENGMARPFDRANTQAAMDVFRDKATAAFADVQSILLDALEERAQRGD